MSLLMISVMLLLRGVGGGAIRGEFPLFVLSGIGLFMLHNKLVAALIGAGSQKKMLPLLSARPSMIIVGTVLYEIYMQLFVIIIFIIGINIYYGRDPIDDWVMVSYIFLLTIFWSISVGLLFMAIEPYSPNIIGKIAKIYRRMGMITSGKMLPGNFVPRIGGMGLIFLWNPLFHCIDQMRGAVFMQYVPFVSTLSYPFWMSVFISLGSIMIYVDSKGRT